MGNTITTFNGRRRTAVDDFHSVSISGDESHSSSQVQESPLSTVSTSTSDLRQV
jgi:hypothetical protein